MSSTGCASLLIVEGARVHEQALLGEQALVEADAAVRVEGTQDGAGAVEHLPAIVFGDTDDVGDHVEREQLGDIAHEVDIASIGHDGVEDAIGAPAELALQAVDHAGRESPRHEATQPRVRLAVHRDQHLALSTFVAVADLRAVEGSERLGVTIDGPQVRMTGEHPERFRSALAQHVRVRVLPHRRFAAQEREDVVREIPGGRGRSQ